MSVEVKRQDSDPTKLFHQKGFETPCAQTQINRKTPRDPRHLPCLNDYSPCRCQRLAHPAMSALPMFRNSDAEQEALVYCTHIHACVMSMREYSNKTQDAITELSAGRLQASAADTQFETDVVLWRSKCMNALVNAMTIVSANPRRPSPTANDIAKAIKQGVADGTLDMNEAFAHVKGMLGLSLARPSHPTPDQSTIGDVNAIEPCK